MGAATAIVKQAYEAFGRGDVPAIMELVAEDIDWEFVGPKSLAFAGHRHSRDDVRKFFADIPLADDIHIFEPREFMEAGDNVTVLGWESSTAVDTNIKFETPWMHLFTGHL